VICLFIIPASSCIHDLKVCLYPWEHLRLHIYLTSYYLIPYPNFSRQLDHPRFSITVLTLTYLPLFSIFSDTRRLTGLPETIEVCLQAPSPITTTKFNPFGTILASGSISGDILLWAWSTRGIARTFSQGHTKAITSLVWSSDGRQLLSASLDGSLVIWDVLSGSKVVDTKFENQHGGILHVGAIVDVNDVTRGDDTDGSNNWLNKLDKARFVLAFQEKEAQIINLKDLSTTTSNASSLLTPVPVTALEGPSRGARLLTGSAAAATGQCVATSPCGRYIASAARGVVCLISAVDGSILDALKIKGVPKKIKSVAFDSTGKQLLVATTDKFVRIYTVSTINTTAEDIEKNLESKKHDNEPIIKISKGVDMEALVTMAGEYLLPEGSFIHTKTKTLANDTTQESSTVVQLKLTRLFDAQVEKLSWGACAFSPDGHHLVTAIDPGSNEHVIYTWNIFHGYAENTLQAGSDGIVELTWHPEPAPMQCLAVGKSGKIYVWAKVMTQDWSAFAPDFETLTDNREHIEEETEFDVEIKAEGEVVEVDGEKTVMGGGKKENNKTKGRSGGKKGGNRVTDSAVNTVEGEEIDIESWDWLGETHSEMWKSGWSAAGTAGPLLHLPVIWPTVPPVEEGGAGEEADKEEQEVVPMAVDDAVDDGGKEEEKVNSDGGEKEGDAEGANKKARIE
jgi:WD40 repeat protein